MPEERSSGEVKQLEPGKFFVRAFLGYDEAYKRIYKSKTVYGTRRDANRVLRELIRLRDDNKVTRSVDTLNEHFELWLEKIMKHKVAKRTYRDYRGSFERYIKKSIGSTELRKLKHRHVHDLYDDLFTRGLSRRTVVSCHTVLNMALNYAVKIGKLAKNPAQGYEFPKKRRKPVEAYTVPEAQAFLEAAQSDPYFAFFAVMLLAGLRPSEAVGLQWGDIDFKQRTLRVDRAVTRYGKEGWEFTPTKNDGSQRAVVFGSYLMEVLKEHRANAPVNNHDLIFGNAVGEPLDTSNLSRKHFHRIRERIGLKKIKMYNLRATSASTALNAGIDAKRISERLGHRDLLITSDHYLTVFEESEREDAEKLESLLRPKEKALN